MDTFEIVVKAQMAAELDPIISEHLNPLGFENPKPLFWVRSSSAPIRELFTIAPWKGGHAAPRWGVSFDFAPHMSGDEVRWHRSAKSAYFDFLVDPHDRELDIPIHRGVGGLRLRASDAIKGGVAIAANYWERHRTVLGAWKMLQGLGSDWNSYIVRKNFGNPLAPVFLLAAHGDRKEARVRLDEVIANYQVKPAAVAKLRAAIESLEV